MRWLLCLTTVSALAAPPVITELRPRGAQKGRPFELTISGRYLSDDNKITSTLPATFTPLTPERDGSMMEGRSATFLVEPSADVPVGVYPVRVENGEGISNILLLTIGAYPEITEEESEPGSQPNRNDSIEKAQGIPSTAVTVNGTLRGPERDVYRFSAKAGERRVFEVEARRCGSAIDPVIQLMDAQGKLLARSEDGPLLSLDARLDFTFPREGFYYVEVHDARYSTQTSNFYRLKAGSFQYATEVFPLGGKRGEQVEVSLSGTKVKADLRNVKGSDIVAFVNLPDSPSLPVPIAIGDFAEVTEPAEGALTIPLVINGQIAAKAERDQFRFQVTPGEELLFELQARELGTSKLMGVLTAVDGTGQKIGSAGDGPLPVDVFQVQGVTRTSGDPFLNVKVPEGAKEITITVEDLARRGGPGYGYRLIARKQGKDFQLSIATPYVNIPAGGSALVNVSVDRRGYNGPIQLEATGLPTGVKAEGGYIPEEILDGNNIRVSSRRGVLILTSESAGAMEVPQLTIVGVAQRADGEPLRRQAHGTGMMVPVAGAVAQGVVDRQRPLTAGWLGLELPAAIAKPDAAQLSVELVKTTRKAAGDEFRFKWTWKPRQVTQRVPEIVSADMVNANDVRVIDMKQDSEDRNTGTFLMTTTRNTNPSFYDFYITGKLTVDGVVQDVVSRPLRVRVEEVESSVASAATDR